MDKYDILKKQIDSYELLPDVISDEEVISAYDLYQILKEELEPLEELFEDADKFKEQINQDNIYIKRVGLFRKVPTIDYICDYVFTTFEKKTATISARFCRSDDDRYTHYTCIHRDVDDSHIYFDEYHDSNEFDELFIQKYQDRINNYFDVLEKYGKLLGIVGFAANIDNFHSQVFTDDFLNVEIKCNSNGKVKYRVFLNDQVDQDRIFSRAWSDRPKLCDYVSEKGLLLLKKVSLEIDCLNKLSQKIIGKNKIGKSYTKKLINK